MTTLTAFLLIILIGFLKNPGIALFGFIFFSLTFYMASSFIPPIGDHIYHIGVANQIGGWAEAFAFDRVASSPNAPFFKFMMLLFEDVKNSYQEENYQKIKRFWNDIGLNKFNVF